MLENILRKASIAIGIAMLIASIYLSYDGFDQKVSGGNPTYTILSAAIGLTLAIAFSLCEFIVSSKNEGLNSTLRWLGLLAYIYSIYTNYVGLQHLLSMDMVMAGITAAAMDILPEQMIAWGLGEAVMHDLFGNLGKFAAAPIGKGNKGQPQQQPHQQFHQQSKQEKKPQHQPQPQKIKGHARLAELQNQFHMAGSNNGNGHKHQKISRSFLDELEEEDE